MCRRGETISFACSMALLLPRASTAGAMRKRRTAGRCRPAITSYSGPPGRVRRSSVGPCGISDPSSVAPRQRFSEPARYTWASCGEPPASAHPAAGAGRRRTSLPPCPTAPHRGRGACRRRPPPRLILPLEPRRQARHCRTETGETKRWPGLPVLTGRYRLGVATDSRRRLPAAGDPGVEQAARRYDQFAGRQSVGTFAARGECVGGGTVHMHCREQCR